MRMKVLTLIASFMGGEGMSEAELIDKLAVAVAQKVKPAVPLDVALWDIESIAVYLIVSKAQAQRYIAMPGFPDRARFSSEKGKGHPRWRAREVIEWAEKHFPKRHSQ